ncbi:MAG: hypothetical protein CMP50_03300 [Flavobacteriales bacterium]|nr:hypothetical protein [Flavobacteriales bacterium]|tara:strand:+ start:616 stop:1122 length:507 start_codon:yes stop_codon:yes gene_type:complete
MLNKYNLIITGFIILGVLTRIIPHPPNFTAVGAVALFGGAFFTSKKLSFLIPIAIMLISDLILGYSMNLAVYISFMIMVCCGFLLKQNQNGFRIINITILGSLIFFIVTNFSVFLTSSLYPKSIIGLIECYTLAIPFFLNTIIGNIIYSLIMFYGFNAIKSKILVKAQ